MSRRMYCREWIVGQRLKVAMASLAEMHDAFRAVTEDYEGEVTDRQWGKAIDLAESLLPHLTAAMEGYVALALDVAGEPAAKKPRAPLAIKKP